MPRFGSVGIPRFGVFGIPRFGVQRTVISTGMPQRGKLRASGSGFRVSSFRGVKADCFLNMHAAAREVGVLVLRRLEFSGFRVSGV